MIGLFITAEPTIFNIDSGDSGDPAEDELSQAARILWPCAFAFGFLPVAIGYVLTEKEMKREEVNKNSNDLKQIWAVPASPLPFCEMATFFRTIGQQWENNTAPHHEIRGGGVPFENNRLKMRAKESYWKLL